MIAQNGVSVAVIWVICSGRGFRSLTDASETPPTSCTYSFLHKVHERYWLRVRGFGLEIQAACSLQQELSMIMSQSLEQVIHHSDDRPTGDQPGRVDLEAHQQQRGSQRQR